MLADLWLFLWIIAWNGWSLALVALLLMVLTMTKEERRQFELDVERKEGGTIYRDLTWELKGDVERVLDSLSRMIVDEEDREKRRILNEQIATLRKIIERTNRMLRMKRTGGDEGLESDE